MKAKYKDAFRRIQDALAKIGHRITRIKSCYYVVGKISESTPFRFNPNDITVSIATDRFDGKTYRTVKRQMFKSYTNKKSVAIITE